MDSFTTVKELKAIAKEQGIPGYYRMRKAELIEAIQAVEDHEAINPTPPPPREGKIYFIVSIEYRKEDPNSGEIKKKSLKSFSEVIKIIRGETDYSALYKKIMMDKRKSIDEFERENPGWECHHLTLYEFNADHLIEYNGGYISLSLLRDEELPPGYNREDYKCIHGEYKYFCDDCPEFKICPHNIRKFNCKKCRNICIHKKFKYFCRECGGSQICPHNRRKSTCRECKGVSICIHNKIKHVCIECGGSQICEHGRQKIVCRECGGSQICEHNRQKYQCKDCKAKQ